MTALVAAALGFLLDACDVMMYVFAIPLIRDEFQLTNREAGLVGSFTLVVSAFGGLAAGRLADRIGRKKTLMATVLLYSAASGGAATSGSLPELIFWRALTGLGLGGEWAAGAVLVAESWPARSRAKAIGVMQSGFALGYMLAAGLSAVILPRWGWRVLFLTGMFPALLTLYIRRNVEDPAVWRPGEPAVPVMALFAPPLGRVTLLATTVATSVLLGYWGLFTWLPSFLAAMGDRGGVGLGIARASGWMMVVQLGALAGYLMFGWMADRIGRRPAFRVYVLGAAAMAVVYGLAPYWSREAGTLLLLLGLPLGFFGAGYFSLFGTMLSELYPTGVRAMGAGFCYNFGRVAAAAAPFTVGALADRHGYGTAVTMNAVFFVAAAVLIGLLPETRNRDLDRVGG